MNADFQNNGRDAAGRFSGVPDWIRIWVPVLLLATIGFAVAWYFVKPAPPSHVVIATGSKTGKYFAMGAKYADYFTANGITLEVRETKGSGENFELLQKAGGDVDAAIVQGGSSPESAKSHIQSVAGIYYEPVLVFVRGDRATQLTQLAGRKIAVGPTGSGTRLLATSLLSEVGVVDQTAGTSLLDLTGDGAADALTRGEIDAAFYVISPDVPVVARLLSMPGIHLMNFDQARAYGRLHPSLSAITLYQGSVDLKRNLPETDVQLVASPATIVVRSTTHSAVIELLVRAAQEINSQPTLLSDANTFPSDLGSELPVNHDAKYFLKNAPSILHRTVPFWLASMIDRLIILVVPLLVVLIPLFRTLPLAMRWRVERRLLNRYRQARSIEEKLDSSSPPATLRAGREKLLAMENEMASLRLPIAYAKDLYNLRQHVLFIHQKLERWLDLQDRSIASENQPGLLQQA